jgi:hypothetical protein
MKKRLILLAVCFMAAFSAALTQPESSGNGALQAPEVAEVAMAIAMLSPAFGYLLVKRRR